MEKSLEELVFIVEEAPEGGYIAKAWMLCAAILPRKIRGRVLLGCIWLRMRYWPHETPQGY